MAAKKSTKPVEKKSSKPSRSGAPKSDQMPPTPSVGSQVDGPFELTGPIHVDGNLHFTREDMFLYEKMQLQMENFLQKIGLKKAEMEQFLRQVEDRKRQLQLEYVSVQELSKRHESDLTALIHQIQSLYGIDLSKVVYDDKTGRISSIPALVTQP